MSNWTDVAAEADLFEGAGIPVAPGGRDIALFAVDGEVFATDNLCTHGNARLCDGFVEGREIECPLLEVDVGPDLGHQPQAQCLGAGYRLCPKDQVDCSIPADAARQPAQVKAAFEAGIEAMLARTGNLRDTSDTEDTQAHRAK